MVIDITMIKKIVLRSVVIICVLNVHDKLLKIMMMTIMVDYMGDYADGLPRISRRV